MTTLPEVLLIDSLTTPIGEALLVVDDTGRLRALDWVEHAERLARWAKSPRQGRAPRPTRDAIDAYFAGELEALRRVAWLGDGTEFQRTVWQALTEIPAGTTLSYGALAAKLGRPKAMRAVGLANGSNPISVVVPCHRVIGADGTLTGYGGGLPRKRWLLRHEGARFVDQGADQLGLFTTP